MIRCLSGLMVLGLVVAACAAIPSPAPTNASGAFVLPTIDTRGNYVCEGVATDGVLAGDPNDPRLAWLLAAGKRVDIVFPYGFSARFTPRLEVRNAAGAVVARDGDHVDGGCVTGDLLLLLWP